MRSGAPPRPSTLPLVSGIAPSGDGNSRPLSGTQLRELEAWLRLHQQGWRRNIIPPVGSSYMVWVDHSDGAATEVFVFSGVRSQIYFANHGEGGRFDAGWLHLPLAEVDDLIAILRKEA